MQVVDYLFLISVTTPKVRYGLVARYRSAST